MPGDSTAAAAGAECVCSVYVCARECVCLCMFNEHGTVPARAAVIAFQYAM